MIYIKKQHVKNFAVDEAVNSVVLFLIASF